MNKMQNKLFEMFKWLVQFLDSHSLNYFIIGGTMLGAIRHGGFIPWDDDIDIAMPRNDYEKLLDLFEKPIENYCVESPRNNEKDYVYGFSKFYDLRTTLIEDLIPPVIRGIYIDIFPLDGIGNTFEASLKNYKKVDRLNMLLTMRVAKYRKDRKFWKNIAAMIGKLIPLSPSRLAKKLDLSCKKINYNDAEYVGNLMSTYRSREIMEKRIFGRPTKYKFEGLDVTGPECYEEYLTILFHDWRKLPPEEKRKSAHDFVLINYEKAYMDYED